MKDSTPHLEERLKWKQTLGEEISTNTGAVKALTLSWVKCVIFIRCLSGLIYSCFFRLVCLYTFGISCIMT